MLYFKIIVTNFKPVEFEGFKKQSGENSFIMSPKKWKEATDAIGLYSKSGRYDGGTFAHKDIAFEFASWLSPEFKTLFNKRISKIKRIRTKNYIFSRMANKEKSHKN